MPVRSGTAGLCLNKLYFQNKTKKAPLQFGPEGEPELGGGEVARLAVGAVGARAPVDMIKALARCGVDIGQARLGYDTGDFAHGAQGDVLVVDTVASGRALR